MSDTRQPKARQSEARKSELRQSDAPRPRRGAIPYALIAMVFVPLAAWYFALLRDVEGFRFAHPFALALIPPAVALAAWAGLARAPGPSRPLRLFARRRAAAPSVRAWSPACAICRRCCGSPPWSSSAWRWPARRARR